MDPKFQSSFIPKGSITQTSSAGSVKRGGQHSFFGVIATIIFAFAIIAAAGAFGYNWYLSNSISRMTADIDAARQTLDEASINKLSDLDTRLTSVRTLLSHHVSISPLFDYIESNTYKNIRFNNFNFATDHSTLGLSMSGEARGYAAVALQSDKFNTSPYFKSPIISNLSLDDNGNVLFDFKAEVDPKLIAYKTASTSEAVVPPPAARIATTTTFVRTATSTASSTSIRTATSSASTTNTTVR